MKYRKKPVVVEAVKITTIMWNNLEDWPVWLKQAWDQESDTEPNSLWLEFAGKDSKLFVITDSGKMEVLWGDYIIQGIQGELYPCKPDIFEATYEEVGEE